MKTVQHSRKLLEVMMAIYRKKWGRDVKFTRSSTRIKLYKRNCVFANVRRYKKYFVCITQKKVKKRNIVFQIFIAVDAISVG